MPLRVLSTARRATEPALDTEIQFPLPMALCCQQSDAQLCTAVKRREAFTRANVGLSRAIRTTIIVSPLDMAGQPGACGHSGCEQPGFHLARLCVGAEGSWVMEAMRLAADGGLHQNAWDH